MKKSKPMTIAAMIKKHPELGERLAQQGFGCSGCPLAQFETIDEGAMAHGISAGAMRKAAGLRAAGKRKSAGKKRKKR